MSLKVSVPPFTEAAVVRLRAWHAAPGDRLAPGATLVDLIVDLGGGLEQDCPPVSVCRIVLREECRVERLCVAVGADVAAGAVLALLANGDDAAEREARVTVAAVLDYADWWSG